MNHLPIIAIVGRPNVGKSTLFNRLIGRRYAITSEIAGTTRDKVSMWWNCNGYEVLLIDTGGLENEIKGHIEKLTIIQAKAAIDDADLAIFLTDINQNLTVDDLKAAEILRRSKKNVILAANKCDNPKLEENIYELYKLGFGEPIPVSAIHEHGIDKLSEAIEKNLAKLKFKKPATKVKKNDVVANICILGKPNTGKSSLVNALIKKNKHIVSDIPGTTRDTLDTEVEFDGKKYNLIDTAGIRRRGKIEKGIEKFSILRLEHAIDKSDIVFLMMDGSTKISKQDCHIAELALEKNKGFVLIMNKIDLLKDRQKDESHLIAQLRFRFDFVPWAPVLFISAKTKENVTDIFNIADKIMVERIKRIPTAELNNFFQRVTFKHLPSSKNLRKPKYFYATQADVSPPTFVLFFKNVQNLHFSYPRYLENELRKQYQFTGTSIRLKFKNTVKEVKEK
jgi:GTP-binding protein